MLSAPFLAKHVPTPCSMSHCLPLCHAPSFISPSLRAFSVCHLALSPLPLPCFCRSKSPVWQTFCPAIVHPLQAEDRCATAASSVYDDRHTTGVTTAVRASGGRRTMNITTKCAMLCTKMTAIVWRFGSNIISLSPSNQTDIYL